MLNLIPFPLFSPCDFSSGSRHQIPQHFPNHRQVLVRFVLYLDVSEQVMEVPRLGGKMAASLVGNETKSTHIWNKSHLLHCKKWLDPILACKDWGLAVLFCSMLFCEEAYLFHWSALAFFFSFGGEWCSYSGMNIECHTRRMYIYIHMHRIADFSYDSFQARLLERGKTSGRADDNIEPETLTWRNWWPKITAGISKPNGSFQFICIIWYLYIAV